MKVRRLVLAFLFGLGLITFLDRICFSVAGSRIIAELKLDSQQWGWAQGVFILGYGLLQIPLSPRDARRSPVEGNLAAGVR